MKITFILQDNSEKTVSFIAGETILDTAKRHDISLRHNCEGFGVCGTCHVIIEEGAENLPEISSKETMTLDLANGVSTNSRLACQVVLQESNDGLKVRIP